MKFIEEMIEKRANMKKQIASVSLLLLVLFALTGCGNSKVLEQAKSAVDTYNTSAASINDKIEAYNSGVQLVVVENKALQDAVDSAQSVINKGETPFGEATLTALKEAMTDALDNKVADPEELNTFDILEVDETGKKADLESLIQQANSGVESIGSFAVPDLPEVPDYSDSLQRLSDAQIAFEDSVQGLKQITNPTAEFVMGRLQRVETITAMDAVTEDHDPNGKLNKQGGYTACVYFTDTQVDRSRLYIAPGEDNVIDVGCDGGGAIEVYRNVEDATKRDTYLGGFDGTAFSSGSHYVYGTIIIRTSDELNGTKQLELTDKILQALLLVER